MDSLFTTVVGALLGGYFQSFHLGIQNPYDLHGQLNLAFNSQGVDVLSRIGLTVVLYFAYFMLFEMIMGATPGKLMTGLRVTDAYGRRVSWPAAFVHNLIRPIDAAGAYLLGGIVAVISFRRQRIGDHIAGTLVVDARSVQHINGPYPTVPSLGVCAGLGCRLILHPTGTGGRSGWVFLSRQFGSGGFRRSRRSTFRLAAYLADGVYPRLRGVSHSARADGGQTQCSPPVSGDRHVYTIRRARWLAFRHLG